MVAAVGTPVTAAVRTTIVMVIAIEQVRHDAINPRDRKRLLNVVLAAI